MVLLNGGLVVHRIHFNTYGAWQSVGVLGKDIAEGLDGVVDRLERGLAEIARLAS